MEYLGQKEELFYDRVGNLLEDSRARYEYDAEGLRHEMEENGYPSSTVIQIIPTDLHGNIPHIGSASDMRGGFK